MNAGIWDSKSCCYDKLCCCRDEILMSSHANYVAVGKTTATLSDTDFKSFLPGDLYNPIARI